MKWIVTGGCGFIGTNAAMQLTRAGDEVIVLDNLHRPQVRRNLELLRNDLRLECHIADVRESSAVEEVFARHADVDVVLHLAGQVSFVASLVEPRYDFEANALGTFNVLEAVRTIAPNAVLIYSSTNKVYGDLHGIRVEETPSRYVLPDFPDGLDEGLPLELHGGYGCSKGAADQYVLDYHRYQGLRTVVLRQSSIYGGHQYATADQGWIAYFVKMAVLSESFSISGSGKQVRDALHVDDLVRCFRACVESIDRCAGQAMNIGGGPRNSLSLLELFDILRNRPGLRVDYHKGAPRPGDQRVFVADTSLARELIRWEPTVPLSEGLERLVEWSTWMYGEGTKVL